MRMAGVGADTNSVNMSGATSMSGANGASTTAMSVSARRRSSMKRRLRPLSLRHPRPQSCINQRLRQRLSINRPHRQSSTNLRRRQRSSRLHPASISCFPFTCTEQREHWRGKEYTVVQHRLTVFLACPIAMLAVTSTVPARADFFDDARKTFETDIPHFFQDDIPCAFGGNPTSGTKTSCKPDQHSNEATEQADKSAAAAPLNKPKPPPRKPKPPPDPPSSER